MRYLELTSEDKIDRNFIDFQNNVLGKEPFTVLAKATWCSHCERLEPYWNKAIQKLKDTDANIVLVEDSVLKHMTDAHSDHTFSQLLKSSVSGYPTIMKVTPFVASQVTTDMYNGSRERPRHIANFVLGIETTDADADSDSDSEAKAAAVPTPPPRKRPQSARAKSTSPKSTPKPRRP